MPEVTIDPTPCVWMGTHDDLPEGEYQYGWAFFWEAVFGELNPAFDRSVRPPITVMIPSGRIVPDRIAGTIFCIDKLSTVKHEPWDVTVDLDSLVVGQKPSITVRPSIHAVGVWHGWLTDGVLHQ